jgi:hypothetical protein
VAQFDAKTVHKNDWGVIGGGALVLIASFLTWFSKDIGFGITNATYTQSGWNSGFLAWFGILCAIAAAGLVAARVFGVELPKVQLGWRTIVLALSAVAALFFVLKLVIGESRSIIHLDRGIGLFLAVIGAVVQVVFAYFAFAASGERADIDRMRAERAAKAGTPAPPVPAGFTAPPPPPVYAPPPVVDAPAMQVDDHGHDHDDHEGHDHPH